MSTDRTAPIGPAQAAIASWLHARRNVSDIARLEHPDITDRYGRVWIWRGRGTLYSHDKTLAFDRDTIPHLGLPHPALASNPNYQRLCDVCRSDWPTG